MSATKEQMIRIIESQPDESGYDEILFKLAAARKVRRGHIESASNRRWKPDTSHKTVRFWT